MTAVPSAPKPERCPECGAPGDRITREAGSPSHGEDRWRCENCGAPWSTHDRHRPPGTLTASEVRAILSASSVDTSRLDIREEAGGVVIRGPERDRGEATGVLFEAGLAHAPYGDRDEWVRRQDPGA